MSSRRLVLSLCLILLARTALADDAPKPLADAELAALPDDDARSTAETFAGAVDGNSQGALDSLLPIRGVKLKGKPLDNLKLFAKIEKKGVRVALGLGADGSWMVARAVKGPKKFGVFKGSGYGKTTVAVFAKGETGWQLDEIKTVDLGAP